MSYLFFISYRICALKPFPIVLEFRVVSRAFSLFHPSFIFDIISSRRISAWVFAHSRMSRLSFISISPFSAAPRWIVSQSPSGRVAVVYISGRYSFFPLPGLDRPDTFPIPILAPAPGTAIRLSLLPARPRMPASQALPDGQGDRCVSRHGLPPLASRIID